MTRIVYLSWPAREITGGIKMVFAHVEALRSLGLDAVVATEDGGRPGWFESTAPLMQLNEVRFGEDILVFPENHYGLLSSFANWPNKKIVFLQNPYMAFRGIGPHSGYEALGVSELIGVSAHTMSYCRRRYPDLPAHLIPYPLNVDYFKPRNKYVRIAFIPRKRGMEAACIRDLFRAEHPQWNNIPWVEISQASEQQVAEILGESAIYLSLARFESFGLSLLEAMSCACVCAGFTGYGGDDFCTTANGFWAPEDDCFECTSQLARAVDLVTRNHPLAQDVLNAGRETAFRYHPKRFVASLERYWRRVLAQTETPVAAG